DLSDPSAPTLQASLKIPGFSTYMHPIGDTHLLTIGREADSNGIVTGLKLSLFDVADATAPRLAHEHIINDPSVVSEALHEHKAFSYFPAQSLLAVPLSTYRCDQSGFVGLRALNVDLQSGFQVLADLSHSAFYPPSTLPYCGYSGYADVRRSLRIEDHLYVLSGKAVTAHPLADLTAPATASVTLPDPRPAGDAWLW
ncbi:MAG: beta-propeller domain-containing protein, partial [Polyangiales bacterium]